MSHQMRVLRLLILLLTLTVAVSWPAGRVAGQDDPTSTVPGPEWISLGPPGPAATHRIAVSDDHQTILAIQSPSSAGGRMIRSLDGGRTWATLAAPSNYPDLTLVPSSAGLVLYASLTRFPSDTGTSAWLREVMRSFDLGDTWETVVTIDQKDGDTPRIVVTPAVDGPVLATIGTLLFRAEGPRAAWAEMPLPDEQQLQSLVPSPNYSQDGLLFAALIRTEPWYWWREPTETVLTAHERSVGVAVSADGGQTWQPVGGQPQLDGLSYRHVRMVAVSPTFATDRTLFAHAWGPFVPPTVQNGQRTGTPRIGALFRSRDAGASWEAVDRDDPDITGYYARIALSPNFATDGVALLSRSNSVGTNTCVELRTADGGSTWTTFRRRTSKAQYCSVPMLFTQGGQLRALLSPYEWSPDGGQTWGRFRAPGSDGPTIVPASGVEASVYVGGYHGGIFAFGPGVAATNGQLPCTLQPAPHIGALLNTEPSLRTPLGCPAELERPVTFRERGTVSPQKEPVHGYWIEGQGADWLAVRTSPSSSDSAGARWMHESKLTQPWPDAGHTVHQGVIQRFDGGLVLTHPNEAGGRTIRFFVFDGPVFRRDIP